MQILLYSLFFLTPLLLILYIPALLLGSKFISKKFKERYRSVLSINLLILLLTFISVFVVSYIQMYLFCKLNIMFGMIYEPVTAIQVLENFLIALIIYIISFFVIYPIQEYFIANHFFVDIDKKLRKRITLRLLLFHLLLHFVVYQGIFLVLMLTFKL